MAGSEVLFYFLREGSDRPEAGGLGDIDDVREIAYEVGAFFIAVEGIEVVVAIVPERFHPGVFAFAGKGLEEGGYVRVFLVFAEIEEVCFAGSGQEVEENEDLFFGEDAFFFAGEVFCGFLYDGLLFEDRLFFDDGVNVELVVGIIVDSLLFEFYEEVRLGVVDNRGVEEFRGLDAENCVIEGLVKICLGVRQEFNQDIGPLVNEHFIYGMNLHSGVEVLKHRWQTGDQHIPPVFYQVSGAVLQDIAHGRTYRFGISETMFFIQLEQPEMTQETKRDAVCVPA